LNASLVVPTPLDGPRHSCQKNWLRIDRVGGRIFISPVVPLMQIKRVFPSLAPTFLHFFSLLPLFGRVFTQDSSLCFLLPTTRKWIFSNQGRVLCHLTLVLMFFLFSTTFWVVVGNFPFPSQSHNSASPSLPLEQAMLTIPFYLTQTNQPNPPQPPPPTPNPNPTQKKKPPNFLLNRRLHYFALSVGVAFPFLSFFFV